MVNGRNETILVFYEFGSSQETIALRFERLLWLRDPWTKTGWFRIERFGPGRRKKIILGSARTRTGKVKNRTEIKFKSLTVPGASKF